jgi:hypothetical protein
MRLDWPRPGAAGRRQASPVGEELERAARAGDLSEGCRRTASDSDPTRMNPRRWQHLIQETGNPGPRVTPSQAGSAECRWHLFTTPVVLETPA